MLGLYGNSGRWWLAGMLVLAACAGDDEASGGFGGLDETGDGADPGNGDGDGDGGGDGSGGGADDGDSGTGDGSPEDDADEPGEPTCDGVDCAPGVCIDSDGSPVCQCPPDHAAVGLSCMQCAPIADPADLDVGMLELTGTFTINKYLQPPQSEYDDARIFLRNVGTGDEVLLGNTHDGSYAQTVIPGTYDLYYELETGGTDVPANRRAKLDTLVLSSSDPLDIDIEMETVRGNITLNGLAPPPEVYENGKLYLRNLGTGDEVYLGQTRSGSYRATVIPGIYAVY